MNQTFQFVLRLLVLMTLGLSIVACGPSDEEKAAAEQQAKAKRVVKKVQPVDPLAGMSSAVTGTKGTLPVDVRFELLDRPEPHIPVNIRLAIVPTMDLIALHAVVKPTTGLQVSGDTQVKFDAPKNGEIKEHKFVATSTEAGIFIANIDVTVTRDTGDTTFTFSIPVPVPDKTAASATAAAAASSK
ncbi:MAG TPA: hypothetical protein VHL14_04330 [Steroidobacteraceae bacterium]|jgi:hypothetical protein|nr:hypothetical protein [Steroidobacteraceae bacterium]